MGRKRLKIDKKLMIEEYGHLGYVEAPAFWKTESGPE